MPATIIPGEQGSAVGHNPAQLCHIVTPVGMLGYGFDEDIIDAELTRLTPTSVPIAIILDSGSTDAGPAKLATGEMTMPKEAYKRDLKKLIQLVDTYAVPLLFSSAGGDGTDTHVDDIRGIVEEIVSENFEGRQFKVLSIYSEVSKTLVKQRLERGQISGCGSAVPTLTAEDIDAAPRIVAQMGCEPLLDAMQGAQNFDIVIAGRAYDPSPYVAWTVYQAINASKATSLTSLGEEFLGGVFHMGKIMECGGLCATPKCHSSMATIYADGSFDIRPLTPGSRCTPLSVAAHTLYEKSRPDLLYGPGGCLDLTFSKYEQLPDQLTVRVRGGLFKASLTGNAKYTVKLEAARLSGYRTIFMGAFKDPILISQLDYVLDRVRQYVSMQHRDIDAEWQLDFHTYGNKDGSSTSSQEIFVIGEALADTQALATSIVSTARIACIHGSYPGQKATSGNFAFGIGGQGKIETGQCAEFCMYHLMELRDGEEGAREITSRNQNRILSSRQTESIQECASLFSWTQDLIGTKSIGMNKPGVDSVKKLKNQTLGSTKNSDQSATLGATKSANNGHSENGRNGLKTLVEPDECETLGDLASVIRSKNAGPYEVTLDVMFASLEVYKAVKSSNLLTISLISDLFAVDQQDVIFCGFFDQAQAFKATIPRKRNGRNVAGGGFMENDVHGSQQYFPLMQLRLPDALSNAVKALHRSQVS